MRTVKVGLEADVAGFKEPIESAKRSVKDLDDKVEALDRDLDKLPGDALKAGAAMKALGGDIRGVGTNLNAMGDKSSALTLLDSRISKARDEVKKLVTEFEKTGDVEIFQRLGRSQGELNALKKIRKDLADSIGDGGKEGASTFASFFQGGIIDAFKSLPGPLKAAVVEAAIVAAVGVAAPVGAAINGALLAGIGAGGLALGIVGQLENPQVKAAYTKLGQDVKGQLTGSTGGFIQPLIQAAKILDTSLTKTISGLGPELNDLAQHIPTLAKGIGEMLERAAPGFAKALEAAGPILDRLGNKNLPELGKAFDKFFALMADGSEGASKGLDLIFLATETLIVGVGGLIDGFSHLYNLFLAPGEKVLGWWDELTGKTQGYGAKLEGLGPSAKAAAGEVGGAAEDMKSKFADLDSQISDIDSAFSHIGKSVESEFTNKLLNQMFALDDATLGFQDSLNKLDDSVKKNGRSLNIHTDEGLKNARALEAAVKANAQLYEQNVLSGMGAEKAADQYKKGTDELYKQAAAAGFNKQKVQDLIGKYDNIPNRVATLIATEGLTDALNGLSDLLRTIFKIPKDVSTTITTYFKQVGHPYIQESGKSVPRAPGGAYAQGGLRKAAVGMFIPPSDPGTVLTGEPQTGGEWLIPSQGISQGRAQNLLSMAGHGYGLSVAPAAAPAGPVGVTINFAGDTNSAFATSFMRLVRTGVIQIGGSR